MHFKSIKTLVLRLVRAPKADEIGRNHPVARRDEGRNHLAVQVAPGRFAVQGEENAIPFPDIEIVDAQSLPLEVIGRPGKAGQIREALVGGAHPPDCRMGRWTTLSTRISKSGASSPASS